MTIMKNPLDDHRFYRLLFPFRPPEFEFKGLDNPELINKLYQKYLKASSKKERVTRYDIFEYYHFMEIGFYLERGYTEEEAYRLKQEKIDKRAKTFSKKHSEEILEINKKKSYINFENLKKKYPKLTNDEIKEKIEYLRKQSRKNLEYAMTFKKPENNHFSKEYYITKGYTELEAQEILSKNSATRNIDYIKRKYNLSDEEAKEHQKEIVSKYLKTYYGRPDEERREIAIKRTKDSSRWSKRATLMLNRLILELKNLDSKYNDYTYLMCRDELMLKDTDSNKVYYYDFLIKEKNIIVEYQGQLYHPQIKDSKFITVEEAARKDKIKKDLAIKNGYKIYYHYEMDRKLPEYTELKKLAKIINEDINHS